MFLPPSLPVNRQTFLMMMGVNSPASSVEVKYGGNILPLPPPRA
jgi:hypothetical protein